MKRKGRNEMLIAGIVLVVLVAGGAGGALLFTAGERREAKNLPIRALDFKQIKNGTYVGEYKGGMYKWRANKVQVTVTSSKVTDIKVLEQAEKKPAEFTDDLFGRVIREQSLQVDTISGATLTCKAFLKAIENALD